jgi:hypothetical protein
LLILITSVSIAETSLDLPVYKGDSVPFDGILVPEEHYRKFSEALEYLDMHQNLKVPEQKTSLITNYGWVIGIFAAGLIGGVVLVK